MAQHKRIELTFLHTSDVHGAVFGYNYFTRQTTHTGLPAVYSYAEKLRSELGQRLILTDGGDCLQGQPTAYYYNFIDTVSPHLVASAMNQMEYVCSVMGNHDIETGHKVYDRWISQLNMPVLGANVVDTSTGKPYLTPYIIIEREGVRIALLGMVTPGIPYWLPEQLWSGLRFDDIAESSRQWIPIIQQTEHPDLIVGIFHSGLQGGIDQDNCRENAVKSTAAQVAGFDFILYGHDHHAAITDVLNPDGQLVKCIGPTNDAVRFALVKVEIEKEDDRIVSKNISATIPFASEAYSLSHDTLAFSDVDINTQIFEAELVDQRLTLNNWVNQSLGTLTESLVERDAYFGPSRFIDFIHQMQLDLTGADISFAAPLSYDATINAGPITVNDMFSLYKFENFLYTMRLSGQEIKDHLEMSYGQWCNQMHGPDDHIMLFRDNSDSNGNKIFRHLAYNMDSAAGILYTVDVTKPIGQRINIQSLADGTPFHLDRDYRVAINSYRGNGGGELLTRGAGIPRQQLPSRILQSTDKDLRYYIMERIKHLGTITPRSLNQWRFVPDEWAKPALQRDRHLLFGD